MKKDAILDLAQKLTDAGVDVETEMRERLTAAKLDQEMTVQEALEFEKETGISFPDHLRKYGFDDTADLWEQKIKEF